MKDKLSALLDGDLDEPSSRAALNALSRDATLRREWETYCLIGDMLRREGEYTPGFTARVMAEIDAKTVTPPTTEPGRTALAAANQRRFWQLAMPVAASVMGVLAVGLVAQSLYTQPGAAPITVADAPASVMPVQLAGPGAGVMPVADRDALNRQFVFMHQSTAAGGPISNGVQYIRTVSDVRGDVR